MFRDFPIQQIHPEAMVAAMAAQCAADQGKYWQYHDKIFREQDRGSDEVVRFKVADLKKWGTAIGLDAAALNACIDSSRYKDEVAKDYAHGAAVGVQGTPMFFINGRAVAGAQPFPVFKKIIDEFFNHANYGAYTTTFSSAANYGKPFSSQATAYLPRILQPGFHFAF